MKKCILLFILLPICLFSCKDGISTEEHNKVISENYKLQEKVKLLENEIEQYKYSPEKLLAEANEYFKKEDIKELNLIVDRVQKYHPESKEAAVILSLEQKLTLNIENKLKKEEEKRLLSVSKLKKKFDDVSGITWYKQPYFTHYTNTNFVSLYMGHQTDSKPWLRLMMSYTGSDWIFFEKAYLSYDGNTQEIFFKRYGEKESDNDSDGVWEWIDISVGDSLLEFLRNFKDGKELKVRFSGKYTKTRNLSTNEKRGIQDLILAYDVLCVEK